MTLEELLKDDEELSAKVKEKIDAINSKETDKRKHIRFADLSEGGYVAKDKYQGLETDLQGKTGELEEANKLIAELQAAAGKDEEAKQKFAEYEQKIAALQAENEALKVDNALKFALSEAGGADIDYLMFKAKEKGEEIKLDEDGKIKGANDLIAGLKIQMPNMFPAVTEANGRKIFENNLPKSDGDKTVTQEQFRAMGYSERLQLKKDNPEQYENLMKG